MSDYGQPAAANRTDDQLKVTFAGHAENLVFGIPSPVQ